MAGYVPTLEYTRQYLQGLLGRGLFGSGYEQYVEQNIRRSNNPDDSTFYTRTRNEQGGDAAEAALHEWNTKSRRSDYASLIEPVARGMLAMWKHTTLIDEVMPFLRVGDTNQTFVLINQVTLRDGCMPPEDWEIFGPQGRLGIKALMLSYDWSNDRATLGVVLPIRGHEDWDFDPACRKSGFTVVEIRTDGHTNAHTCVPNKPDPDFLLRMLGLKTGWLLRGPRGMISSGGHLDDTVFPGATDYLANQLPRLEEYFRRLAERLNH